MPKPVRIAVVAVVLLFAAAAFLTLFVERPVETRAAKEYFHDSAVRDGLNHAFQRRSLYWTRVAVSLVLLGLLALRGGGARIAGWWSARTGGRFLPTVLLTGLTVVAAEWVLHLPAGLVSGWILPRHWGLANPGYGVGAWLWDRVLGTATAWSIGGVLLGGMYLLMRRMPRTWWLPAAGASAGLAAVLTVAWPVVVEPLFHRFTPIGETKWAGKAALIREVARKAGLTADNILVMDAGRRSSHTNAYVSGLGATQRVVLYDTLLAETPDDELASVFAHELGHQRHNHILTGLLLGAAGGAAGLWLLSVLLRRAAAVPAFRMTSAHDPAGVPLVLLLGLLGSWIARPVELAISRSMEREADAFALEITADPAAFAQCEMRMAARNIADVAPNPVTRFLFHSHPTVVERLTAARAFAERQQSIPPGR